MCQKYFGYFTSVFLYRPNYSLEILRNIIGYEHIQWYPSSIRLFQLMSLKSYKNEHSFELCHWAWSFKLSCKIPRRYDQPFSRKWRLKLLFLVVFRIFPNGNCHFRPWIWKTGCDVARLYVLQSYRSCTFCKRKTRGASQFWIELAAPFTIANNIEMNSDDRLPIIIFLTPVSCDGSKRLLRQRLLPSPCSLWRHKQTLVGVIRPLVGGKCQTFRRVTEQYRFYRYLCFHFIFCVRVFCILFCTNRMTISCQNCIHSNSTLIKKKVDLPTDFSQFTTRLAPPPPRPVHFIREKEGDLIQSYKKNPIPTENSKTKGQHSNATKHFDYTTIADRQDGQLE